MPRQDVVLTTRRSICGCVQMVNQHGKQVSRNVRKCSAKHGRNFRGFKRVGPPIREISTRERGNAIRRNREKIIGGQTRTNPSFDGSEAFKFDGDVSGCIDLGSFRVSNDGTLRKRSDKGGWRKVR